MSEITLSTATIPEIVRLYHAMPEFEAPREEAEILRRLETRETIALIAYCDGEPAGFKLGYGLEQDLFYSWLGGVLPAYRNGGIAGRLLQAQETLSRQAGYRRLQVKTRNGFPDMLRLLIKHGYHIIDFEKKSPSLASRLLLEKTL